MKAARPVKDSKATARRHLPFGRLLRQTGNTAVQVHYPVSAGERAELKTLFSTLTIGGLRVELSGAGVFLRRIWMTYSFRLGLMNLARSLLLYTEGCTLYKYGVLMFGLFIVPGIFRKVTHQLVLRSISGAEVGMDDMIDTSATLLERYRNLRMILIAHDERDVNVKHLIST